MLLYTKNVAKICMTVICRKWGEFYIFLMMQQNLETYGKMTKDLFLFIFFYLTQPLELAGFIKH